VNNKCCEHTVAHVNANGYMKDHIIIWAVAMKTWLVVVVMHTTWAVVKLKPEKNSGLNRIWSHDLWDTGALLYQLSYQALYMIFHYLFTENVINGRKTFPATLQEHVVLTRCTLFFHALFWQSKIWWEPPTHPVGTLTKPLFINVWQYMIQLTVKNYLLIVCK